MEIKPIKNPFSTAGYHGESYFCDREKETEWLLSNIANGNSSTIISIRRLGKTGLIHHALGKLPKNYKGIYIDILPTERLNDLFGLLSSSLIQSINENTSFGQKIWNVIKSFRPTVSFDSLSGQPQVSFDLKPSEAESSISSILQLINSQPYPTVIAIDEFQQIASYPEKNSEAWLRGIVQQLNNVVFIFSGSQQHLMSEIFSSPKRPFYRSTQLLKLQKIDRDIYADFIVKQFEINKKSIAKETAAEILNWCDTHTYYVQLLCNKLFAAIHKVAKTEHWKQQANALLMEQEPFFINYRNLLTTAQWKLFKAIASEGIVYHPTASEFIRSHNLSASASVIRALNSLLGYELIYRETTPNGETYYKVYDILFQNWVKVKNH